MPSRRALLEGRGVDLFFVETFSDLDDLEAAVAALRSVSSLPIVALMSFDSAGDTLAGVSAEQRSSAAALARRRRIRRESRRRARRQRSARSRRCKWRRAARSPAERRPCEHVRSAHRLPACDAGVLRRVRRAGSGARRADHRRLLRHDSRTDRGHPHRRRPERSCPRPRFLCASASRRRRRLRATSRRCCSSCSTTATFVVSVQLDPPLGANPESLLATARAVRESGKAQFVDVNDNPRARARMSGIMAVRRDRAVHRSRDDPASHAARHDDCRPRVAPARSACRGRCATSSPSRATRRRPATIPAADGVYEVDSIGLVELMARLNRGEDFHGRAIDAPTSFFPGVAVNPTADDLELEVGPLSPQGRSGRALRDDPDSLRPRAARRFPTTESAARGRSRCSSASGRSAPMSRRADAQRDAGAGRSRDVQERYRIARPRGA